MTGEYEKPVVRAILIVSPYAEDHEHIPRMLDDRGWQILSARTYQQAMATLREDAVFLVICERDLPDGTWKDILRDTKRLARRPLVIVASRLADDYLWAEVLNMGGHDVLSKPFHPKEVAWTIGSAVMQAEPATVSAGLVMTATAPHQ